MNYWIYCIRGSFLIIFLALTSGCSEYDHSMESVETLQDPSLNWETAYVDFPEGKYSVGRLREGSGVILETVVGSERILVGIMMFDGMINISTERDGVMELGYKIAEGSRSSSYTFPTVEGRWAVIVDSDGDGFPDRKIILPSDHDRGRTIGINCVLDETR